MSKSTLPQDFKIVQAAAPITTNLAVNGDYVSLKNAVRATVLVSLNQTVAHATAITLYQATDVSGSDAKAIANAVPIWANEDISTSDLLEAQTAAVSYTVGAAAKDMLVAFQVDPALLDVANGFDCLQVRTAASSQATNHMSAVYLLENKYAGEDAPSAIVD